MMQDNTIEEFRDIPNFDGYQVSNFGRVKTKRKYVTDTKKRTRLIQEKIRKQQVGKDGYFQVGLSKDGKIVTKVIHRLMHITFTDKFNKGLPCIDHIDRDRTNNHIDNLRECTIRENGKNLSKQDNKSSKYLGVHWNKRNEIWEARIRDCGKKMYIGQFKSEIEAGKAYDAVAKYYHKEFANLNFPNDDTILPTTIEENRLLRRKRLKLSSKYRGVTWDKKSNKWGAQITINSHLYHLGVFINEEDASNMYDSVAKYYLGKDFTKYNNKDYDSIIPIEIDNFK